MKFVVKVDYSVCKMLTLWKEFEKDTYIYRIPSDSRIKLFPEVKVKREPLTDDMVAFCRFDKEPFQKLISTQTERDIIRLYPLFEVKKEPMFSLVIWTEEEFIAAQHYPDLKFIKVITGVGLDEEKKIDHKVIFAIVEGKNEKS